MEFTQDTDKVYRTHASAAAHWPITIERHDREKFQKEGHFVPRMVDEHGMPRDWDGPLVFVGVLNYELKDALGNVQAKSQVLRVLADTPAELFRLMELRIVETFYAQFQAGQMQSADRDTVKRLNDENTVLRAAAKTRFFKRDRAALKGLTEGGK
jgi:hypothetical protein